MVHQVNAIDLDYYRGMDEEGNDLGVQGMHSGCASKASTGNETWSMWERVDGNDISTCEYCGKR